MREIRALGHVPGGIEDLDPDDPSRRVEIEHDARAYFLAYGDLCIGALHVERVRLGILSGLHRLQASGRDPGMR